MIISTLVLLLTAMESVPFPNNGLEGEALAAYIERQISANGGTPLVRGHVFHFFYKASPGEEPRIEGDFELWRRGRKRPEKVMTHLGGGWHHYGVEARPQARMEYIFRIGGEQRVDPRNPHVVKSWMGQVSVARMPDYPPQPELTRRPDVARGELAKFRFKSDIRRNERDVHVYTPAGYQRHQGVFPTLYFGDGAHYVEMAEVPRILDNLIADKRIPPVIAVFIDPVDRWLEYRMFTLYRGMMLEELMPYLKQRWRLDETRQVIIGGSRGGLSALDFALTHPDRFMGCIAIAPAVTETDFPALLRRMQVDRRPRFSILVGAYDFWGSSGREVAEIMKAKGYRVEFREAPIGHSIYAWRGFLDDLLSPLLLGE